MNRLLADLRTPRLWQAAPLILGGLLLLGAVRADLGIVEGEIVASDARGAGAGDASARVATERPASGAEESAPYAPSVPQGDDDEGRDESDRLPDDESPLQALDASLLAAIAAPDGRLLPDERDPSSGRDGSVASRRCARLTLPSHERPPAALSGATLERAPRARERFPASSPRAPPVL